jgi:hypothetical protein
MILLNVEFLATDISRLTDILPSVGTAAAIFNTGHPGKKFLVVRGFKWQ